MVINKYCSFSIHCYINDGSSRVLIALTHSAVKGDDVPVRHGDEEGGGREAAHHAGEDHVPRPQEEGDEDGDDAADEEAAVVEGVDEDGLGREERQGAAYSEGVGLKRHKNACEI